VAEGLQEAPGVVGDGLALRNQLRPHGHQKLQRLSVHTLDGDLAEPPGAHHLREAVRVVGVGLVDLKAQRGLGVPGIKANHH